MIGLVSMIGSWGSPEKVAIEALVVGIIATLATDLWLWLPQIVGVPPANWALVGRWVAWMPRGVFVHRIAATPSIRGELVIGWGFHYAVGIAYAVLYLAISRLVLASGPTLISTLVFAIALLVVPWFVMQPALGLGFFAARTPRPSRSRLASFELMRGTGFKVLSAALPRPTDPSSPTLNLCRLLTSSLALASSIRS